MNCVIVIMGVSGSGKTTVGRALAERLACTCLDADDFHSEDNIEKMNSGIPLTDKDRWSWLEQLCSQIMEHHDRNRPLVLACSALKKRYRDILREAGEQVAFVYLEGSFELISHRMKTRKNHYMKEEMLKSQFEALEPLSVDERMVTLDAAADVETLVDQIITLLKSGDEGYFKPTST